MLKMNVLSNLSSSELSTDMASWKSMMLLELNEYLSLRGVLFIVRAGGDIIKTDLCIPREPIV